MKDKQLLKAPQEMTDGKLPYYELPEVTTHIDEEIIEEIGPAQAVYGIVDP